MFHIHTKKQTQAFTIVELVVIIAIIAILVALTFVSYTAIQTNARKETARTDVQTVAAQLNKYNAEQGTYPAALSSLSGVSATKSTFLYTYTAGTNTYCLSATLSGNSVYVVSGNAEPQDGLCP